MVKFIMDYKFTGRSAYNHKVQCTKYKAMFNESYATEKAAKHAYIWRYSPKHKLHVDFQDAAVHMGSPVKESSFNRIYDTAIEYLGGFPKPPEIVVYADKFKLFERSEV